MLLRNNNESALIIKPIQIVIIIFIKSIIYYLHRNLRKTQFEFKKYKNLCKLVNKILIVYFNNNYTFMFALIFRL